MKKRLLGIAALATTSLALFAPMMTQTALAASRQGGSVELTTPANLNSNAITPFTVVNVGGGQWNYGTSRSLVHWSTTVWSDYLHPSLYHSSSAEIGNQTNTAYANAGSWSDASAVGGYTQKGYAYWNTY